jgi:uncharacterized membrane protein
MDGQEILSTLSRILHVGTAVTVVGGTIFMKFVLHPAASTLPDEAHDTLKAAVMSRWKKFVHIGIGLFLISGIYNMFQAIPNHKGDSLYHALVGTKVLLALGIFFIASALVGSSKAFEGMRANRPKWMGVIVLLAAIVIGISGFVKVRGIPDKNEDDTATAQVSDVRN